MAEAKKAYSLEIDYDNFKSFLPKDASISIRCKGQRLNWSTPVDIKVDEEDIGMPEADISLLNIGSFVISEAQYIAYFSKFEDDIEFLQLSLDDKNYYLCNVINAVDCLHKEDSTFNGFGGVKSIVFDKHKIPKHGFFKIAENNFSTIFCTETVKSEIASHKYSGIEFDDFPIN